MSITTLPQWSALEAHAREVGPLHVRDLFARYQSTPGDLPAEWLAHEGEDDEAGRARRIGDFIAGMTDRYAIIEHRRLFDSTPDLR